MSGILENKVAIVTGGGTGIGKGIAIRYANEGAKVAVTGRRLEKLEDTIGSIKASGKEGIAIPGDVSKPADIKRTISEVLSKWGRIDILVNNAAIEGEGGTLFDITDEMWDQIYSVNTRSVFIMTREVAKVMIEKEIAGKIINISSITSKTPPIHCSAYASAKAAVNTLTVCSALDLGEYGINVNCICPGLIATPMLETLDARMAAQGKITMTDLSEIMIASGRLMKRRIGQPDDIAKVAVFLASDASEYVSGQVINVCGGLETH